MHFAVNLNSLTPGGSEQYDRLWKLRTLFDKLLKDYQAMQPESYQLIDEHMCKFKGKNLMRQYMKNEQIKRGFKFWFCCVSKLGYLYDFDMYLRKKENSEFGLGEWVALSLCECLKDTNSYVYCDKFFESFHAHRKIIKKWHLLDRCSERKL